MTQINRLAKLGLDWDVRLEPLFVDDRFGPRKVLNKAVVRQDTGATLGVVGPRYTPVQNRELENVAQAIASQTDTPFSSGGCHRGGALVYLSLKLPRDIQVGPGDTVQTYLVMSNPHDGSGSARINVTTIRPSCQNQLRLAWTSSLGAIYARQSLRHTKSVTERLIDVKADLSKAIAAVSEFEKQAQLLRNTKPTERMVDEFIKSLGFSADETEGKKREEEMAFRKLMITAPGQELAGNSLWRLVNGATYWADHAKVYRKGTDKAEAIAFGTMAEWKTKAFTTALEMAKA